MLIPLLLFLAHFLGKIKWIREESLSEIAAVEMVDLPLADSEGAIEKQLKSDNGRLNCQNRFVSVNHSYQFLS